MIDYLVGQVSAQALGIVSEATKKRRVVVQHRENTMTSELKPCCSPYCECDKGECSQAGFYDDRSRPSTSNIVEILGKAQQLAKQQLNNYKTDPPVDSSPSDLEKAVKVLKMIIDEILWTRGEVNLALLHDDLIEVQSLLALASQTPMTYPVPDVRDFVSRDEYDILQSKFDALGGSCSMSWAGKNVYGDAASIKAVKQAIHEAGTVPDLKDIIAQLQENNIAYQCRIELLEDEMQSYDYASRYAEVVEEVEALKAKVEEGAGLLLKECIHSAELQKAMDQLNLWIYGETGYRALISKQTQVINQCEKFINSPISVESCNNLMSAVNAYQNAK